eukprot:gene10152-11235_t
MRLLSALLVACLLIGAANASSMQVHPRGGLPSSFLIRGGAKKPSFFGMIKAFWLSLIDPSNEEGLRQAQSGKAVVAKKGNKKASKGRKLSD